MRDERGLLEAFLSDGRFLLSITGLVLVLSGGFAIFQSLTGYFLPQDVHALGFDARQLAAAANMRVVHFMFHDRVAFGGTMLAVGLAYWYLAEFPLRGGDAWAWWTFCISGICGFASFLAYLSYGYLDNWHGIATLLLLPVFLAGLWRARPAGIHARDMWQTGQCWSAGRRGLVFLAAGMIAAGATIMVVGMTRVFVPQDLEFIRLTFADLQNVSPRLVPLIAHDRAGFGGGLISTGIILLFLARHAPLTRSFVQIVMLMGVAGFGTAIGVHPAIGYTNFVHLAPAYFGALFFGATLLRLAAEQKANGGRGGRLRQRSSSCGETMPDVKGGQN
jgi:hypothetical protein